MALLGSLRKPLKVMSLFQLYRSSVLNWRVTVRFEALQQIELPLRFEVLVLPVRRPHYN